MQRFKVRKLIMSSVLLFAFGLYLDKKYSKIQSEDISQSNLGNLYDKPLDLISSIEDMFITDEKEVGSNLIIPNNYTKLSSVQQSRKVKLG